MEFSLSKPPDDCLSWTQIPFRPRMYVYSNAQSLVV